MSWGWTNWRRHHLRSGVWLAACLVMMFATPAVGAQTGGDAERIERLEQEVAALRAEIAKAAEAGAETARLAEIERRIELLAQELETMKIGEAAALPDQSDYGMGPAASNIYRTERGLSVGGYGEAVYQKFDDERDDGTASGRLDQADLLRAVLYFGYKWNDRLLWNAEVEYEHGGEEVGVEFAYLDALYRPQANLRAGLVLVPMGFVNELHEPTVFRGVRRPDVERVILPSTWREVGFGLFGDIGPVSYRTYLVNGFDAAGFTAGGLRGGRQNGGEAKAEDFAWVGRADWHAAPGLLAGGSAYFGKAGQDGVGGADVGVQIVEGHVEWKRRGFELRALAVDAELDDVAKLNSALGLSGNRSVGEKLRGGYVQAGYDFLAGGERSLVPFARWETFDTQARVPAGFVANPANDVELLTVGLSYSPIPEVVWKLDYQDFENGADTGVDQLNVAFGYVF